MKQLVLVLPDPPHGYRAQAVGFSEISSVAESEDLAVELVRQKLASHLTTAKLVTVDIPAPIVVNPLVALAGRSRDDPDFDLYLEEIERYRKEVEARECSDSSSIPTI